MSAPRWFITAAVGFTLGAVICGADVDAGIGLFACALVAFAARLSSDDARADRRGRRRPAVIGVRELTGFAAGAAAALALLG